MDHLEEVLIERFLNVFTTNWDPPDGLNGQRNEPGWTGSCTRTTSAAGKINAVRRLYKVRADGMP